MTQSDCIGRLHSIETFGTLDGPGIRIVLFFQGCPLQCAYCHNRDTWTFQGGQEWDVDELVAFILKYQSYIRVSGGGVTASGGDPLLQHRFVTQLFKRLKAEGIHTALDTAGYCRAQDLDELIEVTDLVLLDLKAMRPQLHKMLTNRDNKLILDFAHYLAQKQVPTWIRRVIIPGVNDGEEELLALKGFVERLSNVEKFELLPYHILGKYKWDELNIPYPLEGVPQASAQDVARAAKIIGLENY